MFKMNILEIFLNTNPWLLYVFATLGTGLMYASTAGLAFAYVQKLKKKNSTLLLDNRPFKNNHLQKEILWSATSIFVFGFNALLIQWMAKNGWAHFSQSPITFFVILMELIIFLLWNELHFFLVHRLFHTPMLFRFHKVHHAQANISPLSIFCFHPLEAAALGSVIPIIIPFYNFHIETVFLFVFASMLLNTWGHSGLDLFKKERWPKALLASQRHFDHHKFHKINFGFFFRVFDETGRTTKKHLLKTPTLLVILSISLFINEGANSATPTYRKKVLELDRYYHVKDFSISYPPNTDVELRNLLENSETVSISCNKDVLFLNGKKQTKSTVFKGVLYPLGNAQKLSIRLEGQNAHCMAKTMGYAILISPETSLHPKVAQLRIQNDACQSKESTALSFGCHTKASRIDILSDSYEALNARFKVLMGYDLGYQAYLNKDPNMFLDFARAPQLDLVIFDTLQVNKDFVGILHIRMLEHHLRQGAKVYITTSKALLLPHETGWIYELKRRLPGIHLNLYEKSAEKFSLKEAIHSLHRNSHIKVLLTYSQAHPENNAFIAGGRNASEMYFYPQQPDNSAYPQITQWGKEPLYGWVYFNDLDFKVSGTPATEALARSLMSYNEGLPWNLNQSLRPQEHTENSNVSFYLSSPFAEGRGQLEKVYIDLFRQAKKTIRIMSPYLNFTKPIAQALQEAKSRGVDIQITTNLSIQGDFMPGILQPAMNKSVREVIKKYKIKYFSVENEIYHTKAIIVDESMILLGSINMNQRSFIHDTEIAFLFKDLQVIQDFNFDFKKNIGPHLKILNPEQIPRASIMELLISPFLSVF